MKMMSDNTNRRDFLKVSSAGLLAATVLAAPKASTAGTASDKLVAGVIGTGGRGVWDAGNFQKVPNVEIAYVCDVDERRRGVAAQKLGVDSSRVVSDMRKILDDKAVDAVII